MLSAQLEKARDGVGGGARAGLCAVRGERNAAGEERCRPAPFVGDTGGDSERQNSRSRRTDESVEKIPDSVEIWNFVGEKLEDVKADGETENDGMRETWSLSGRWMIWKRSRKPSVATVA